MCILFIAVQQHPDYPLIIAANRDEYYNRPTDASDWWPEAPSLLAGRDLRAGGTWMGMTQQGKIAALTNIRAPHTLMDNAQSRGELVSGYLMNQVEDDEYADKLRHSKANYNGYNLLFGQWDHLQVYNNHLDTLEPLTPGFYGLSNANLNSPWPKVNAGVKELKDYCQHADSIEPERLFNLLQNTEKAADDMLPVTGAPPQWEKLLSSIFIETPSYGTRCSTLILIDQLHQATWIEHNYDDNSQSQPEQHYKFVIATD